MPIRPSLRGRRRLRFFEQLEDRRVMALAHEVLADINTQPDFNSSIPRHFAEFNGETYFVANGYANSSVQTVWKSDGTAAGTRPLLDSAVFDGDNLKTEGLFVEFKGKLVFPAYSAEHGVTIWETDGTSAGTRLAAETSPGPDGGAIEELTNINGTLFFSAFTPDNGVELWKWDGVSNTATLVTNADPNIALTPRELTNVNGELFFIGYQEDFGHDYLFKSDGTSEGTVVVADVDSDLGRPEHLTNLNGRLIFSGSNPNGLWTSDGTPEGTVSLAQDSTNYGEIESITVMGDQAYFWMLNNSYKYALWRTDGTQAGTHLAFATYSDSSFVEHGIVELGGSIYITGRNGNNANVSTLWKLDPTNYDATEVAFSFDHYSDLSVFQDKLYFYGSDDLGLGLWTSDGTEGGTHAVNHFIAPGKPIDYMAAGELFVGANRIFMSANDKVHGVELWASDGTAAGTGMLKDLIAETASSNPSNPVVVNGVAYFVADDGPHDRELWKSDGTASGTMLVKDISPNSSEIAYLNNVNGLLLFRKDSALWRSDGTPEGTYLLKGGGVSAPRVIDDVLYYRSGADNLGSELWRSDGTQQGTYVLGEIRLGTQSSDVKNVVGLNGEVFFTANDGVHGKELWKSDGSPGNAVRVSDFPTDTSLGFVAVLGDSVYFTRLIAGHQLELWKTDGDWATASIVKIIDSPSFSVVTEWLDTPDRLYFVNDATATGAELWTTDGTTAGTYLLRDGIAPSRTGSQENLRATLGSSVFFTADDGVHGVELWTSDGTVAGTHLVKDIRPGPRGSEPTTSLAAGSQLYFSAIGPAGRELWRTDGTEAGTQQAADFRFGHSFMGAGAVLGGSILVPALGDRYGNEMWVVDLNDLPQMQAGVHGTFVENGGSVAVSPQALVSDVDNSTFPRGKFAAAITANLSAGDQLFLRSHGSGATRLAINGSEVRFGGTLIGTWARGTGGTSLQVELGASATLAGVRAIMRGVGFTAAGEDPSPASRTVRYTLNDGDGPGLATVDATVQVLPQNDAPLLDASLGPQLASVREDAVNPGSTRVADLLAGAVSDPDAGARRGIAVTAASNFNGTWQFSLDGGTSWQAMGVPKESAARLLPGSARVRFLPKADFNGLVKMYYRAWDQTQGQPGGKFDLVGNVGGTKAFSTAKENAAVTVTPVNDAPQLSFSGTIGYTHDNPPITLAPYARLTDVDGLDFAGGRLRVRIADGADASNRLSIGPGFTVDASNNVWQGTTIIGKRVANGFGANELRIVFNASAAQSSVQQLVRAITFKTVGGAAGTRKALFSISDGDGGTSPEVAKIVNVI